MRKTRFTASPLYPHPHLLRTLTPSDADSVACCELSAAMVQFCAISDDVADISSLAVATEPAWAAACSAPVAI